MTGVEATKISIAAFLIPYIFVYNPEILMVDTNFIEVASIILTSLIGMIGIGSALEGWFMTHTNVLERIMCAAGGLCLIVPGLVTDISGALLIGIPFLLNYRKYREEKAAII